MPRSTRSMKKRASDLELIAEKYPDLTVDNNGIFQKLIRKGVGPVPTPGSKVSVLYKGMLLDGTVFDQSALSGGPFSFSVGKGEVIDGWDLVVRTMQKARSDWSLSLQSWLMVRRALAT